MYLHLNTHTKITWKSDFAVPIRFRIRAYVNVAILYEKSTTA